MWDSWLNHQDILKNAFSLVATTGLTSGLGFAYWAVAAKLFSQQSVGYSVAAISITTLMSWLGVFGLGTLLIGELPRRASLTERVGLISSAVIASGVISLILTLGFVVITPHFTASFDDVTNSVGRAAVLCAAVVLTAMGVVFDSATIGLLRGGLQLTRNLTFVVVKMFTLLAAAFVIHRTFGIGIFLSWVAAIPLSLVPIIIRLWTTHELILPRPDWTELFRLRNTVFAHSWLNFAIQGPPLLLPVLVASVVPASVNAGYFLAWTIANMLFILPGHLTTVLFAVAAGDSDALAPKLRFTLRVSIMIGVPAMLALSLGSHFILSIFGAGYAKVATVPLALMALGYLPSLPKSNYIAVCRAQGRISRAAGLLTAFALVEVAASVIGILRWGIIGLTVCRLAVMVVEGLLTLRPVIEAARIPGRHRRSGLSVAMPIEAMAVDRPQTATRLTVDDGQQARILRAQQQAGIALLMSLALPGPTDATIVMPAMRARAHPIDDAPSDAQVASTNTGESH
jgi:O-antigen/teichoic acid export membrane protein